MKIDLSRALTAIAVAAGLTLLNLGCSEQPKQAAPQNQGSSATATTSETGTLTVEKGSAKKAPQSEKAATESPSSADENGEFYPPVLLTAAGEPIRVDSPGYACPCMVDLDEDGKTDLVVGQFRDGNMIFFRNLSDNLQKPEFAKGEWLTAATETNPVSFLKYFETTFVGEGRMTSGKRAQVPGVW